LPGLEDDELISYRTGGMPKAVISTQRMALSNVFSGFVGMLRSYDPVDGTLWESLADTPAPYRSALRAGQAMPPPLKATDPQKVVLLAVPLFHVTGNLSWLMRALYAGSKMVYLRKWDVKEAVRLIVQEGVTVIGG
jgi:acyl-CoA synthetase (AMP-forming)/AMP-acid ligase II